MQVWLSGCGSRVETYSEPPAGFTSSSDSCSEEGASARGFRVWGFRGLGFRYDMRQPRVKNP